MFCIAKRYILPRINVLMPAFRDSNSRKRQQIFARNTIVAASSMPFNLIATMV